MTDLTEDTTRTVNRHMARLLTKLEQRGVPWRIRMIVKSALVWLRDDLAELTNEWR